MRFWGGLSTCLLVGCLFLELRIKEGFPNHDTKGNEEMLGRLGSINMNGHISSNKILPDA